MFIVGSKVTPSMSALSWKGIPSVAAGSVHPLIAIALDLWGFRRDPVARFVELDCLTDRAEHLCVCDENFHVICVCNDRNTPEASQLDAR
jgi:hypothetical protein